MRMEVGFKFKQNRNHFSVDLAGRLMEALSLIMGVHHPEASTWTFAGPAVFSPVQELPSSANIVPIVNPSDLVPKVPLPPLYQHIGQEINVVGAPDPLDFALQHSLDTYAAGLATYKASTETH